VPYKNEEAEGAGDPHGAHVCNIWNKLLKKLLLTEFVKVEEGHYPSFRDRED
jgi:hypothetical protein